LIEDFFQKNGVRYIAMNDGIDTLRDNNDIAPFRNTPTSQSWTQPPLTA
jgi:site-specific DNA recombinase